MRFFRNMTTVAAGALMAVASAAAADDMSAGQLVGAAREGGLVIYVRHASTESDYADQITAVMGDCSTQRALSEAGWAEARAIGAAFARLEIPVGEVISSEYCRAWQTADLAFGGYRKVAALNFEKAGEYTDAQVARMRAAVSPLLAAAPATGTNTLIVGHDDPFEAATGIYPEPMGVAFFLRPDAAGGFAVLGAIAPDDWLALP